MRQIQAFRYFWPLPSRQPGVSMPIKPEMREFYPSDWSLISRRVRFERASGICQGCGRPHGVIVRCLPDGRWFDAARHTWRSGRGRPSQWPNLEEAAQMRKTRVVLAAAHLDHDPRNNRLRNLKSLCQRCHMIHDRPHHLAQRRITYLLRRALGDLFLGPYSVCFWLQAPGSTPPLKV
jgi:ribosomal protein S14